MRLFIIIPSVCSLQSPVCSVQCLHRIDKFPESECGPVTPGVAPVRPSRSYRVTTVVAAK